MRDIGGIMKTGVVSAVLLIAMSVAACGGGGAATAAPSADAASAGPSAASPDDAAFAWCTDVKNQLALNQAASAASVDLDHIQAEHTVSGGTLEQFHAALRADADYMKACTAAYAAR
jgi:hypothetical protein